MLKKLVGLLLIFIAFLSIPLGSPAYAQTNEETFEARVVEVLEERDIENAEGRFILQKLRLLRGNSEYFTIETGEIQIVNQPRYKAGDRLVISKTTDFSEEPVYNIVDFVRRPSLYLLFFLFLFLVIVVGRKRGVAAIAGMAFSFLVILQFILPQISAGKSPVLVAVVASILIIPVTFYLSHGLNKKTTAAIAGTLIALFLTTLLAHLFINLANLSGFSSEEAAFLQNRSGNLVNIKGLLLAGIIVGALGILDDITVSQAAIVYQLHDVSKNLSVFELFRRAMDVGQDHIASLVNTLVLVYAGASLPLMLLFVDSSQNFAQVINYEILAEEVVRTLITSIGLIIAVPITTILASLYVKARFSKL